MTTRSRPQQANAAFEAAYADRLAEGGAQAMPGALEAFERLRKARVLVALHTGFSSSRRDRLLEVLGWQAVADLVLCRAGRAAAGPIRT